ncbi:hypothetical protein [Chryseobacterium sp. NFX27]|uniref:hypothetical protein n=1 Tax=Chryseobacterium sp. NFX27 TaxID=2819618 RepID=UPI003CE9065B
MKKNAIILGAVLASTLSFGQIGINTSTPNPDAALDVVSTNKGILNTRITLTSTSSPSPLSAHVAGMMIYNTATVSDVTPGLYYNDGSKWIKAGATITHALSSSGNTMTSTVNGIARTAPIINSISNTVSGNTLTTTVNGVSSSSVTLPLGLNIYNSDGTLNSDRMVNTNNKMLWFQNGVSNVNNHIAFDVNVAVPGSTRLITRGSSSSLIRALINSNRMLDMELLNDGSSRLLSTGSTGLLVGTGTSSGPLTLNVGSNRATLATNGNFGIGTETPSQKLHVIGNILASGTVTPDYVFEKHFEGISKLNSSYTMMELDEVEEFTRLNKHLPGVPSASEIKTQGGIILNRAAEINLEKIEELYLYVFELKKEIKTLKEKSIEMEKFVNKN